MQHMFDPDDGYALLLDGADGRDQLVAFAFRQAAGNLIQQQQPGLGGKRPRQFQPLALQQGKPACQYIRLVEEARLYQDFGAAVTGFSLPPSRAKAAGDEQVLKDGQLLEGLRDLEGSPHAR